MAADDRVLGDGDFVEQIWSESAKLEKETLRRKGPGVDLESPGPGDRRGPGDQRNGAPLGKSEADGVWDPKILLSSRCG